MYKTPQKPKRVVVFGSRGFVGKKLVAKLNENSIPCVEFNRENCDLADEKSIVIIKNKIQAMDSVVFLSAITPDKGKGIEEFTRNINIAKNLFQAFKDLEVKQFILFSSESIYPITEHIINEKTSLAPPDLYGMMHLTRERIFELLNFPLLIVRPTLIYGDGDTHNSYGPNRFLREAREKGTITLFGEGEETRSHIHVNDVINVLLLALQKKVIGSVNLCPNPTISFMEIANSIKAELSTDVEIIKKQRSSEITHRYFDDTILTTSFSTTKFKHNFVTEK